MKNLLVFPSLRTWKLIGIFIDKGPNLSTKDQGSRVWQEAAPRVSFLV